MKTYIAILRGINVSGKNILPMAELRDLLASQGWKNLKTYIQSGNIVFQTERKEAISKIISQQINHRFGYQVPVLVLSKEELEQAIAGNPYAGHDLSHLYVTFLSEEPSEELISQLPASPNPQEFYQISGKRAYVYCPQGYGRTKINNSFFESKLKVTATTRNWKTCLKLQEMANS